MGSFTFCKSLKKVDFVFTPMQREYFYNQNTVAVKTFTFSSVSTASSHKYVLTDLQIRTALALFVLTKPDEELNAESIPNVIMSPLFNDEKLI